MGFHASYAEGVGDLDGDGISDLADDANVYFLAAGGAERERVALRPVGIVEWMRTGAVLVQRLDREGRFAMLSEWSHADGGFDRVALDLEPPHHVNGPESRWSAPALAMTRPRPDDRAMLTAFVVSSGAPFYPRQWQTFTPVGRLRTWTRGEGDTWLASAWTELEDTFTTTNFGYLEDAGDLDLDGYGDLLWTGGLSWVLYGGASGSGVGGRDARVELRSPADLHTDAVAIQLRPPPAPRDVVGLAAESGNLWWWRTAAKRGYGEGLNLGQVANAVDLGPVIRPLAADVDADGVDELLMASFEETLGGELVVFDDFDEARRSFRSERHYDVSEPCEGRTGTRGYGLFAARLNDDARTDVVLQRVGGDCTRPGSDTLLLVSVE